MRSRFLGLCSAALLASTVLLGTTSSAGAADEMCQGQPATIVGDGSPIAGTENADVVVTNGSSSVFTFGGADLVCVTGSSASRVNIDAGGGDDSVEVTDGVTPTSLITGTGSDRFVGGAGRDQVNVTAYNPLIFEQGADVILTGDGDDKVLVAGVLETADLGPGNDSIKIRGRAGPVSTGPGDDTINILENARVDVIDAGPGANGLSVSYFRSTVDLRRGTLTLGDDATPLLGVRNVVADGQTVRVLGDGADNNIDVSACNGVVKAGRGNDRYLQFDGVFERDCGRSGRLTFNGNQDDDFAFGDNRFNVLLGGPGNDELRGGFVGNRISGGGGDDRLFGGEGSDTLLGGKGRDIMRGRVGADRIFGGFDLDKAFGGAGRDRCVAEVRRFCER